MREIILWLGVCRTHVVRQTMSFVFKREGPHGHIGKSTLMALTSSEGAHTLQVIHIPFGSIYAPADGRVGYDQ